MSGRSRILTISSRGSVTRRRFVTSAAIAGGGLLAGSLFPRPALATSESARPKFTHGFQSGDISDQGAIVWARADRPSRLFIEVATTDSFKDPIKIIGPAALEATDYTAKMDLVGLPAGQDIFYRAYWQDLSDLTTQSAPLVGHFRTVPAHRRDINFVWSGDTAGQGWGINLDWGGMKIYKTMAGEAPDFFIHSGDTIYADGPMKSEVSLPDGTIWKNVIIKEKTKNAETLDEFRGQYKYNLMDANVQAFNAQVPMLAQWDDHETVNNWYPTEILDRDDYTEKNVALLSARAKRGFLEFMPIRQDPVDPERIYRKVSYGPHLDIFFLDKRSYRGPNTGNHQAAQSDVTRFLGEDQLRWLKNGLLMSNATWKVIASDMPVGLVVRDGKEAFENGANGDGPPLGRELEIANLLSFIKHSGISNVVWLTADVHYTAAHFYDPNRAQFQDFSPFWEFVSGPLNAGTYGPNDLDNTFGPQVVYQKAPEPGQKNLSPKDGLQFYGQVKIDGATGGMQVQLKDLDGQVLYSVSLDPFTA